MFILIAQKLTEQFLNAVEAGSKRDLYYWHAYYVSYIPSSLVICYFISIEETALPIVLQDKRLPTGTTALLKLEGNRN